MYSYLASKIVCCAYGGEPAGKPWKIFDKATSGEAFTIQEALTIRDAYFPDEPLEKLFEVDQASSTMTVVEAANIMRHTPYHGEIMPELQHAIWSYVNANVCNTGRSNQGIWALVGWGLAIGRAAGVKEERARRKQLVEG